MIKNKAALHGSDRHNAASCKMPTGSAQSDTQVFCHLFEVRGRLNLPDGLHESVSDNNTDVRSRIALRAFAQGDKVCLRKVIGGGAQVQFEHVGASMDLGQRDVNALFKPSDQQDQIISHYKTPQHLFLKK